MWFNTDQIQLNFQKIGRSQNFTLTTFTFYVLWFCDWKLQWFLSNIYKWTWTYFMDWVKSYAIFGFIWTKRFLSKNIEWNWQLYDFIFCRCGWVVCTCIWSCNFIRTFVVADLRCQVFVFVWIPVVIVMVVCTFSFRLS